MKIHLIFKVLMFVGGWRMEGGIPTTTRTVLDSVLELSEDLINSILLSWHLGSPQVLAPGFPSPHSQDRKQ